MTSRCAVPYFRSISNPPAKIETHINKFLVALSSLVHHTGQVRIPILAILADHLAIVILIISEMKS